MTRMTNGGSANNWGVLDANRDTATYANSTLSKKNAMKGSCASGYHVLTKLELGNLLSAGGLRSNGVAMSNELKLPIASYIPSVGNNGLVVSPAVIGYYYTSSSHGSNAYFF